MNHAVACVMMCALAACALSGSGSSAETVRWKVYQVEHPRPVPPDPIRTGAVELRITKVVLEENKTKFATKHWVGRIRGTILSSEPLPVSTLMDEFTMIGKSGKVYRARVSTVGPGRSTWQHQEHTGQPTHLPASVPGELELSAGVGDDKTHDELAAFTFRGIQVPL